MLNCVVFMRELQVKNIKNTGVAAIALILLAPDAVRAFRVRVVLRGFLLLFLMLFPVFRGDQIYRKQ